MGNISSFGDSLGNLDFSSVAGTALKAVSGAKNGSVNQGASSFDMLERMDRNSKNNIQNLGQPYYAQNMRATKGEPTASVDPEAINQQWLARLHRYSQINTDTSGKR